MEYEWLSVHIFYAGSAELLLHQLVQPCIEEAGTFLHATCPWFFIRYSEGGPHIRLRLQVLNKNLPVMKELLEKHANRFLLAHPFSQETAFLQYIPYVPEIIRYGNAETIAYAENQFCISSRYSLQSMVNRQSWDIEMALAVAFQMHIAFFYALNYDANTVEGICSRFIAAWLTVFTRNGEDASYHQLYEHMDRMYNRQAGLLNKRAMELWDALNAGHAPDGLQAFANDNRSLLQQYKLAGLSDNQLHYALRSLLHMTHNRLGISNREEAWCIFITFCCVQHIYKHAC